MYLQLPCVIQRFSRVTNVLFWWKVQRTKLALNGKLWWVNTAEKKKTKTKNQKPKHHVIGWHCKHSFLIKNKASQYQPTINQSHLPEFGELAYLTHSQMITPCILLGNPKVLPHNSGFSLKIYLTYSSGSCENHWFVLILHKDRNIKDGGEKKILSFHLPWITGH